jgi:NhaA family Na+:H+ antiporter
MSQSPAGNWLDRPVAEIYDHILGPAEAPITLVEYGSYACLHCRAANDRVTKIRDQFGDRLRYVFRHRPLNGNDLAKRAAILVESVDPSDFWYAHMALMTRSATLTSDDLEAVALELSLPPNDMAEAVQRRAEAHVDADLTSADSSGVQMTPTFFINGRRYDGPWDDSSFSDALLGTLGHRVSSAALDFAGWGPSAGILLLAATILAVLLTNSSIGTSFEEIWRTSLSIKLGSSEFLMPLLSWINDGLLTVFFLVVGLEIKREFTVGHLATPRSAALPIAAALGGMVVPVLIFLLLASTGSWVRAWGVPMATDTAFAVALIVMMGSRVPVELRIFLTAAAIVDDIGAIAVVAVFYTGALHWAFLALAACCVGALALLNRMRVYAIAPYAAMGIALWTCLHEGGLHATMTGVILALFIPTRAPANLKALATQADAIIAAEARHSDEVLRNGPSQPALQALDAIHNRLESPADRLLRRAGTRSSYLVLPVFAFANAGVALSGALLHSHAPLMLAIGLGLALGKPLGLAGASALAVWLGLAVKPDAYSWRQLIGAGALAGIGFTMSLFIASQAFPPGTDFAATKVAVFAASILSAVVGVAILWNARGPTMPYRTPSTPEIVTVGSFSVSTAGGRLLRRVKAMFPQGRAKMRP